MLCDYDARSIQSFLSTINQALLHSSSGGKSSDLQKLLRYSIGIVNSTFKDGTDAAGWAEAPGSPGCGDISGVSPTIFVLT